MKEISSCKLASDVRRSYKWGWFPKIRGIILEGPNQKDYSLLGFILGSATLNSKPFKPQILNLKP